MRRERILRGDRLPSAREETKMNSMEIEHVRPADIERTSFQIIEREVSEMGREIPQDRKHVILRVIHTTADFEYLDTMTFSPNALRRAEDAFRRGAHIVTDTTMAMSGINKRKLAGFGAEAHCLIADPEVADTAAREGITRSAAAVHKAIRDAALSDGSGDKYPLIFAVGNAPTALLALETEILRGFRPELVIAVPVGFVNVVQAKERIISVCDKAGIPWICNRGRKGGSNVAAAICNAILYSL